MEVAETCIGGKKPGKRERGAEGKMIAAVAAEDNGYEGTGRIRLRHLPDASAGSLHTSRKALSSEQMIGLAVKVLRNRDITGLSYHQRESNRRI